MRRRNGPHASPAENDAVRFANPASRITVGRNQPKCGWGWRRGTVRIQPPATDEVSVPFDRTAVMAAHRERVERTGRRLALTELVRAPTLNGRVRSAYPAAVKDSRFGHGKQNALGRLGLSYIVIAPAGHAAVPREGANVFGSDAHVFEARAGWRLDVDSRTGPPANDRALDVDGAGGGLAARENSECTRLCYQRLGISAPAHGITRPTRCTCMTVARGDEREGARGG
jgi:hypothetical protein